MRILFTFVTLLILTNCQPELENKADAVLFFDVKQLVANQVKLLAGKKLQVQKFIRHDKQRENNIINISNWGQELKIFEEANLNRPIYKDAYLQKDSVVQDIKYLIFTAKTDRLQVKSLRLAYKEGVLKSLDANLTIENILYHSEKKLHLSFAPNKQLVGYGVKGNFSVIYGAKYDYEIDAVISE